MNYRPTFMLTPRESSFFVADNRWAQLLVFGAALFPKIDPDNRYSFDHQHAQDEVHYPYFNAGDPSLDYTVWDNLKLVPHVQLAFNLDAFGPQAGLLVVFSFDVPEDPRGVEGESRVLIYTADKQLGDETLVVGRNHFLVEIESVFGGVFHFNFIHAKQDGASEGGNWFFQGITGFVT